MEDRFKSLNDGGYNNLLVVVLALVGVYLFVNGFNKSKKQTYLDNAGTDQPTQLAQALRDAMNQSGTKLLMDIDGTDVPLIMETAGRITDYPAIADSYRVLYGSELTLDLQSELSRTDLQSFWDLVYKRNGSATIPGGTSNTTTSAAKRRVTAKQTVNVRVYEKPQNVIRQAKTGELIGTYAGEKDLNVTGTLQRFLIVNTPHIFDNLYDVKAYVHKGSVTIS